MNRRLSPRALITLATGLTAIALPLAAQVPPPADAEGVLADAYKGTSYSPYAGRGFPSRPLWGDTHLHTAASMDAGAFGNRLGLREAYRFARGEEVVSSNGTPAKLSRPLDWLVIADHSDNMGFFPDLLAAEPHIMSDPMGKDWYDRIRAGEGVGVALEIISKFSQGEFPESLMYTPDSAPFGRIRSTRPRSTTIRASSPPSSASSGPRWSRVTTCTGSSSTATAATGPRRWSPIRPIRPRAARTRVTSGNG